MKTRNLFLSLFAFAAVCACNKETDPVGPEVLGEDAYLTVRINATGTATKGEAGGYEEGVDGENDVTNVLLAFYTSAGDFMYVKEFTDFNFTDGTYDPNVESQSEIKVVLEGTSITPRKMLAILNYNDAMKTSIEGATTLGAAQALLNSHFKVDENFVITNSSYWANGGNACASQIEDANIVKEGSPAVPVNVYVERVAAKVSATSPASYDELWEKSVALTNGKTLKYWPEVTGYALASEAPQSYLFKKISDYNFSTWTDNQWNDPTNVRSYWADSFVSGPYTSISYNDINTAASAAMYCHENTTTEADNRTKLMVAVTVKGYYEGEGNRTSATPISVVQYGGSMYTMEDFLMMVVTKLDGQTWDNSGTPTAFTQDQLSIVTTGANTKQNDYKSKVVLKEGVTATNSSEVETILAAYNDLLCWKDGKAYFFTDIEHFGTDENVNDYGVVRNHAYRIAINKVAGMGTPVIDENKIINPTKPETVEYELSAQINILKWKIVSQNVTLDW